jgi:hypothetical protein
MSKTTNKYAPEVSERAVRMVLEHEREHASLGGCSFDFGQDRLCGADTARVGKNG